MELARDAGASRPGHGERLQAGRLSLAVGTLVFAAKVAALLIGLQALRVLVIGVVPQRLALAWRWSEARAF
jgi:hypothetical protein